MAYISARPDSFLGLKNLDTIITTVCLEMPFGGGLCHVETSQLVSIAR